MEIGVQPDRQKVIFKGITLKDEEWNVTVKEGAVILMLGTKDEVPLEPSEEERPKFIEDMNEAELATAVNYYKMCLTVRCALIVKFLYSWTYQLA